MVDFFIKRRNNNYSMPYENKGEKTGITSSDKIYLRFAHLDKIFVNKKQDVNSNTIIGLTGKTGILHGTQGPHLHFEIMKSTEIRKGEARFPLLYNPGFYIDYRYGDKITELDIKQQSNEKNN